jgi:two-component system, chemotaxis family, sensor kinase CheA
MLTDDEVLKEFLAESRENLDQLDRDFVALEADPGAHERIGAIFRTIHTIKGTAGFLGLSKLETLTHAGESLLSMLREGTLTLDPTITSALLSMVDRVRAMLRHVETVGNEGDERHEDLLGQLTALRERDSAVKSAAPAQPVASAPAAPESTSRTPSRAPAAASTSRAPAAASASRAPAAASTSRAPEAAEPSRELVATPAPKPSVRSVRPPAEPRTQEAAAPVTVAQSPDTTVRVDVGLLDKLMNLVGELVLARNQIVQFGVRLEDPNFVGAAQRLNHVATELQEHVMKTRMQPIGNVWSKLPRVIRDLAVTCGKQVRVEMIGKETELDRTILEAIKDPLTHLVRNAVDHGLEQSDQRAARGKPRTGSLVLRAFHEGGQVNIEISDDGSGLKLDAIRKKAVERNLISQDRASRLSDQELAQLVFMPGFSTAARVTNVSGRGVGMDVVKTNIEKIGGTVDLVSREGLGTTIKIKIPLTLAIVPALIITNADQRYAIPQVNLLELVRLEGSAGTVERVRGMPVYRLRGRLLPLVFLNEQLKRRVDGGGAVSAQTNIVVLQADDRQFGLVVDEVHDTEEIVVKPLGKELKGISVFAGATIMGDGRVALILDVIGLAQHAGAVSRVREQDATDAAQRRGDSAGGPPREERQALLLFGVGADARMALPLSLVARIEEFAMTRLERAGNRSVVQYRGEIMPLIHLSEVLGLGGAEEGSSAHVIVYTERDRSVGFVVSRILDVVDDTVRVDKRTAQRGVSGAAVIQGKVTDFLDVEGVIRSQDPSFFEGSAA